MHFSHHVKLPTISKFMKDIVFGANDGIVTTFAVVSGFNGASLNSTDAMALSVSVVLLFGLANLFSDGVAMGLGNYLSYSTDLGTIEHVTKKDRKTPFLSALMIFLAFMLFGFVPLIPYVFNIGDNQTKFLLAIIFSTIALLILGIFRWRLTFDNFRKSVGEILLLGGTAALVAYIVGTFFKV